MNDAVALLAVSQLVCIGGLAYLYMQVQSLRARPSGGRHNTAQRVRHIDQGKAAPRSNAQAARQAYAAPAAQPEASYGAARPVAERLNELGIDIPALARRMHKSEEEVRLLLRRQGALR